MAANAGASVGLSPVMLFLAVTFVVVTGANDGGAEPGAVAPEGTSALIAASIARGRAQPAPSRGAAGPRSAGRPPGARAVCRACVRGSGVRQFAGRSDGTGSALRGRGLMRVLGDLMGRADRRLADVVSTQITVASTVLGSHERWSSAVFSREKPRAHEHHRAPGRRAPPPSSPGCPRR